MSKFLKLALITLVTISGCRSGGTVDAKNDTKNGTSNTMTVSKNAFKPLTDKEIKIEYGNKLVTANNKFAFKLYNELLKDKKDTIFVSPSSIIFCLSMLYNGANGKTQEDIQKALELSGFTLDELNTLNNKLMRQIMNADASVKMDIANSLWGTKGIEFDKTFTKNMSDFYNADISPLDLSKDPAKMVNEWVSNATQKKITKIVDTLSEDTLLLLVNAIYFKGTWTNKFDKTLTKELPFKGATKTKNMPMMSNYDDYRYFNKDGMQAIEMPYGKEDIAMYVFLPTEGQGIDDLHKKLSVENWTTWMSNFSKRKGKITMPKFKTEYETSLNTALISLGMGSSFEDSADFKKFFAKEIPAKVSEVKHKTFVEINEEGTEAAAVTSVQVVATSIQLPQEPFEMNVDSPFLYVIREKSTGTILFMGSVLDF